MIAQAAERRSYSGHLHRLHHSIYSSWFAGWLVVLGCGAAGCGRFSFEPGPDASAPDAPAADAPILDASACLGTGLVRVCPAALPVNDYVVSVPTTLDTSLDANCSLVIPQASGESLCVVMGDHVRIDAIWTARGARPLVVVGASSLSVTKNGVIDVSSHAGVESTNPMDQIEVIGAGANSSLCGEAGSGMIAADPAFSGPGGAGGSFVGRGGGGGPGGNGTLGGATVPGGTPAPAVASPTVVRGGCKGADGGATPTTGMGKSSLPGPGGGAVYLISRGNIEIHGIINASGAGGVGGYRLGGGGGGGAGGMIGLDGNLMISIDAVLRADGGGGGEGGNGPTGSRGYSGDDPMALVTLPSPEGGHRVTAGGDGGDGTLKTMRTGTDGKAHMYGGGGGGGGAGVIVTFPTQGISGAVSPST